MIDLRREAVPDPVLELFLARIAGLKPELRRIILFGARVATTDRTLITIFFSS